MITFFNSQTDMLSLLIYAVAYIMALFVAMPFHEFAHAFVAKKEGDYTATALRRCTLAPHAHIDMKGFVCLMLLGFGWAKPVPVDERNFKRGKLSKFLVSIAGIVTNLLLGVVFIFIYVLIHKLKPELYSFGIYGRLVKEFLMLSISLNFSLAFFNLLPIYPLDGFKIIETFAKWDSPIIDFLEKYSFILYILIVFTSAYNYYFTYTAGFCIDKLLKLFCIILGVWNEIW